MKHPTKLLVIAAGVVAALAGTTFSALAGESALKRADTQLAAPRTEPLTSKAAACSKMNVGDVMWVTVNEDFEIEEEVESYPSGTSLIVPVFEYDCVPKNTTIATVFTYEGEQVYNDKEKLKASSSEGLYGYPLEMTEGAFDDGEWGVEFYSNKTLLTTGSVAIGDADCGDACSQSEVVSVQGVIIDKKSKKPIKGAFFIVLYPGITIEDWVDNDQSEEDIYVAAKTDSKGQFELELPLERNVEYSLAAVAKGYKPLAVDGFVATDEDEDPLELTITLSK